MHADTNRVKSWRQRNPEKRQQQRERYNNRKFCQKHNLEYDDYVNNKSYYWDLFGVRLLPNNKIKQKIIDAVKDRVKNTNTPFNLTRDDIELNETCPYLGIKLNYPNKKTYHPNNYSIDRIVPELGYVKGNVMIISILANQMKSNATIEELITFATNVLKIHQQQI